MLNVWSSSHEAGQESVPSVKMVPEVHRLDLQLCNFPDASCLVDCLANLLHRSWIICDLRCMVCLHLNLFFERLCMLDSSSRLQLFLLLHCKRLQGALLCVYVWSIGLAVKFLFSSQGDGVGRAGLQSSASEALYKHPKVCCLYDEGCVPATCHKCHFPVGTADRQLLP